MPNTTNDRGIDLSDDSVWHYWSKVSPMMGLKKTENSGNKFMLISIDPLIIRYESSLGGYWLYSLKENTLWFRSANSDFNGPHNSGPVDDPGWEHIILDRANELIAEYSIRKEVLGENI